MIFKFFTVILCISQVASHISIVRNSEDVPQNEDENQKEKKNHNFVLIFANPDQGWDVSKIKKFNFELAKNISPCANVDSNVTKREKPCDCERKLKSSVASLLSWAQNGIGMNTATVEINMPLQKMPAERSLQNKLVVRYIKRQDRSKVKRKRKKKTIFDLQLRKRKKKSIFDLQPRKRKKKSILEMLPKKRKKDAFNTLFSQKHQEILRNLPSMNKNKEESLTPTHAPTDLPTNKEYFATLFFPKPNQESSNIKNLSKDKGQFTTPKTTLDPSERWFPPTEKGPYSMPTRGLVDKVNFVRLSLPKHTHQANIFDLVNINKEKDNSQTSSQGSDSNMDKEYLATSSISKNHPKWSSNHLPTNYKDKENASPSAQGRNDDVASNDLLQKDDFIILPLSNHPHGSQLANLPKITKDYENSIMPPTVYNSYPAQKQITFNNIDRFCPQRILPKNPFFSKLMEGRTLNKNISTEHNNQGNQEEEGTNILTDEPSSKVQPATDNVMNGNPFPIKKIKSTSSDETAGIQRQTECTTENEVSNSDEPSDINQNYGYPQDNIRPSKQNSKFSAHDKPSMTIDSNMEEGRTVNNLISAIISSIAKNQNFESRGIITEPVGSTSVSSESSQCDSCELEPGLELPGPASQTNKPQSEFSQTSSCENQGKQPQEYGQPAGAKQRSQGNQQFGQAESSTNQPSQGAQSEECNTCESGASQPSLGNQDFGQPAGASQSSQDLKSQEFGQPAGASQPSQGNQQFGQAESNTSHPSQGAQSEECNTCESSASQPTLGNQEFGQPAGASQPSQGNQEFGQPAGAIQSSQDYKSQEFGQPAGAGQSSQTDQLPECNQCESSGSQPSLGNQELGQPAGASQSSQDLKSQEFGQPAGASQPFQGNQQFGQAESSTSHPSQGAQSDECNQCESSASQPSQGNQESGQPAGASQSSQDYKFQEPAGASQVSQGNQQFGQSAGASQSSQGNQEYGQSAGAGQSSQDNKSQEIGQPESNGGQDNQSQESDQNESGESQSAQIKPQDMKELMKFMGTLRTSFLHSFFEPIWMPENSKGMSPSLSNLVKKMMTQLKELDVKKGYIAVIKGGTLMDLNNPKSGTSQTLGGLLKSDDERNVILSGSCPDKEKSCTSLPLFVSGPLSKEFEDVEELSDIPKVIKQFLMKNYRQAENIEETKNYLSGHSGDKKRYLPKHSMNPLHVPKDVMEGHFSNNKRNVFKPLIKIEDELEDLKNIENIIKII